MKKSILISAAISLAFILSACGENVPEAPALSADEIQSTAVAAAFTIVAQTQAAIPTNTPLPPTETPLPTALPTETPVPLPTIDPLTIPTFTATTAASSGGTGGDPCNAPLPGNVTGKPTKIRLSNETKGELVVSLYLNKTPFGECGFRGYNLGKNESITITDLPTGCYNVSVFVTLPDKNSKSFGYGCINNPDLWEFKIYEGSTVLAPP